MGRVICKMSRPFKQKTPGMHRQVNKLGYVLIKGYGLQSRGISSGDPLWEKRGIVPFSESKNPRWRTVKWLHGRKSLIEPNIAIGLWLGPLGRV